MMDTRRYTISKLTDYSRLDAIHRLTHDTLVEAGDVLPREDGKIANYPHLDRSKQTTILIAEKSGKVIGTNSVSIDGPEGLHTDLLFKTETDQFRRDVPYGLGSSWRIATSHEYRSERMLVLDLFRNTFTVLFERNIEVCLLVFNERHVPIYRRIVNAEVVTQKSVSLDGNVHLNVVLMKMEVAKGWNRFRKVVKE